MQKRDNLDIDTMIEISNYMKNSHSLDYALLVKDKSSLINSCQKEGITLADFEKYQHTPGHKIDPTIRDKIIRVNKNEVSDIIDSKGLLKEGTRIVKYVAPEVLK